MKLDLEKVSKVLENKDISYDYISNKTGMSKGAIYPYRTKNRPIVNMEIRNALKLQKIYDDLF